MWFKNLRLYRLNAPFTLSPEDLAERLQDDAFRSCGSLETSTLGWVPPLGRRSENLAHGAAGAVLICVRKEERILPNSVVTEEVAEKAAEIEEAEGRPVRRKERQSLKEEVVQSLLPRAFTRSSYVFAYLVPKENWLVVDAASAKKAEEVVSLLRKSVGSLPAVPPRVQSSPSVVMTSWVSGEPVPTGVELGDQCELKEPGEQGGVVRVKGLNLLSEEVGAHLETGKQVTKLALQFEDRISCVLDEELAVKRLAFEDTVLEALNDANAPDEAAAFDAQFALMTLELGRFLPQVLEWFGGEEAGVSAA
ncbi:recombination-associated protein RdgC [Thiohalomonas denitrificans]|uniref:Recombination-associated protein RdgC n=1 Tax=Thiohalomonas denitrificans TaxID=415747 RepID=A0A1G5QCL5_9GAMM|nr:recombination-associated protein RdgC [Thiohalomonas denitrificans]SCZ59625.1 recombination associated protein RdgC [Thiohalomonas denitrificans]